MRAVRRSRRCEVSPSSAPRASLRHEVVPPRPCAHRGRGGNDPNPPRRGPDPAPSAPVRTWLRRSNIPRWQRQGLRWSSVPSELLRGCYADFSQPRAYGDCRWQAAHISEDAWVASNLPSATGLRNPEGLPSSTSVGASTCRSIPYTENVIGSWFHWVNAPTPAQCVTVTRTSTPICCRDARVTGRTGSHVGEIMLAFGMIAIGVMISHDPRCSLSRDPEPLDGDRDRTVVPDGEPIRERQSLMRGNLDRSKVRGHPHPVDGRSTRRDARYVVLEVAGTERLVVGNHDRRSAHGEEQHDSQSTQEPAQPAASWPA